MSLRHALDGVLVLSIEQAVAAPLATCRLADGGARVIKVERPSGDFARTYDTLAGGESAYFAWLNRGKESLVADLKDHTDAVLLRRILDQADVFVQNLAPGAAARAGFDSAELRQRHPRLITVDISGYGSHGPDRERKAYDLLIQAESGLAAITGSPDSPGRVGVSACDIATGLSAHAAILEALLARRQNGEGRSIHISLFDSMAEWMAVPLLAWDYAGFEWPRVGLAHPTIAPYGVYGLSGDDQILIAVQNDAEFRRLVELVLGRPELADDPRFAVNHARVENRQLLDLHIVRGLASLDRAEAAKRLNAAALAFGFLSSVSDLSRHPQLQRISVDSPSGRLEIAAPPSFDGSTPGDAGPIPALGEHSDAIRCEFEA